ncbi:MAG: enoyl-CoA hydratase/isomerase family protein [Chloroflexi bacterium]|nr:enoyl-CoA hydratase/isomerase family protein [Chloroflexota bacterium]
MPDYAAYQTLKVDKADRIAVLTFNRPEQLNAVDATMHQELVTIWRDLAEDDEVAAIVVTGSGRAFSSGGDLRWLAAHNKSFDRQRRLMREAHLILENMLAVEQPIIAAVNGAATGLGVTLALFCDIVVAGERARFGDTHVRAGIVAGDGGAAIWPLMVGLHRAKEFLLLGGLLNAHEAERIGLVNRVVAADQLMPTALELARRLADGPTWAIRYTKVSLNQWLKFAMTLTVPTSLALEMLTFNSEDQAEAARAFLDKRAPRFGGR